MIKQEASPTSATRKPIQLDTKSATTARCATTPSFGDIGQCPEVIAKARFGDRAAFAELYGTSADQVYRYVLRRVREPADAEDLASEVFTRAFANIHKYRWQGKSFLAWLYTIARNAITDRRRRDRPTVEIDEAFMLAEDGVTAHERAVLGEEVSELRRAMSHLTDEQQSVLQLRFLDDLSSAQVATKLGKNEGAIRALQFRALARLRRILAGELRPEPQRLVHPAPGLPLHLAHAA